MKPIHREFDPAAPEKALTRELHPKASIPTDAQGAIIDFRSSDETVDRYSEIIVASGWQLKNYLKNPVVQNAHSYWSIVDTIGKALITEVKGDHLYQRVEFAVDANPVAKIAYQLYKGGFLRAVSVGFIPKKWENGSREAGYARKYLESELLEVSAVSIPANPNALKLGFESGAVDKSDLKELNELLNSFCNDSGNGPEAGSKSDAGAPGFGTDGAQVRRELVQMARETALLLKRA